MRWLKIECCDECIYSKTTYKKGFSNFCLAENKLVKENIDFPKWCSLAKVVLDIPDLTGESL